MEDMSHDEMRALASRSRLGHLGLASEDRAYVIPIFYGFDGRAFYFHAAPGLKSEYIDDTEEACFVVTRASAEDEWASVQAFGRVEGVSGEERLVAMDALLCVPLPPEWGFTETGEPLRGDTDMRIYKLVPERMSGRKSARPPVEMSEREIAMGGM